VKDETDEDFLSASRRAEPASTGLPTAEIAGVNFLLSHEPELTFRVDIWVRDEPGNLARLDGAPPGNLSDFGRQIPHCRS
jgi:hypothetical protein